MDLGVVGEWVFGAVAAAGMLLAAYLIGKPVTRAIFPEDRPLGGRASTPWGSPSINPGRQQELIDEAIDSLTPEPLRHRGEQPRKPRRRVPKI
jgi:hypothetical protein